MPRPSKRKAHLNKARLASILVCTKAQNAVTHTDTSLSASEQLFPMNNNSSSETGQLESDDSGLRSEAASSVEESDYDESSSSDESTTSSERSAVDETDGINDAEPSGSPSQFKRAPLLAWKEGAGQSLKRQYGTGSQSTAKRQRRHQRELDQAASNTHKIFDIFKRQQDLGISMNDKEQCFKVPRAKKVREEGQKERKLELGLEDMQKLLRSKTAQVKRYGHLLFPETDFHRRHSMVRSFLYMQKQKENMSGGKRKIAEMVAATYNRRGHTAKKLLKWVKGWINDRTIPESKAGKHKACISLLENEGVLCAIRDFAKTQGEGKYIHLNTLITE